MTKRELYQSDPRLSVGLTSRGTWTVTAGKYDKPRPTWDPGQRLYEDKWLTKKIVGIKDGPTVDHNNTAILHAVQECLEWLRDD